MIALYKGAYGQDPITFDTAVFDIDSAEIAVDYDIIYSQTETVTGIGDIKMLTLDIYSTGTQYLGNVDTNVDSPNRPTHCAEMRLKNGVYQPTNTVTALTIGQKPDDWDAHYMCKYYTRSTHTVNADDYYVYTPAVQPFDPSEQYYTVDGMCELFYTGQNISFGVSEFYFYFGGSDYQSCLFYPCTASVYNMQNDALRWHIGGLSGSQLFAATPAANYLHLVQQQSLQEYKSNTLYQFCTVDYNGDTYIGMVYILRGVDDVMQSARFCGITKNAYDNLQPGAKNWGKSAGVDIGRNGSFDNTTDSVSIPGIPGNLNIANFARGMHTYVLTAAQLSRVFDALWADSFFKRWQNLQYNPIAGIVSVHQLPCLVSISGSGTISISGTELQDSGGFVTGAPATERIHDITFSAIPLPEYYGSYLDYSPNTRAKIALPFAGEFPLDISDFMGGSLQLQFRVDVVTGDCLWFVYATNRDGNGTLRKVYAGNCAWRIPVSGNDGGAAGLLSALSQIASGGVGLLSGNIAAGGMGLASGIVSAATAAHHTTCPAVQGNASAMGNLTPYIMIERTVQLLPENYGHTVGYAAPIGGTVGETADGYTVSGFAQYAAVDLSGIPDIDSDEAEALENLLKGGIWL